MKTYVFPVQLQQEADGRWSSWCDALPGCASWGQTEEEALRNIQEAIQLYIESLNAHGEPIPTSSDPPIIEVDFPAVSVTV